ncbi:MAG: hypothetical protein EDM05_030445 [Leptolyngbya sp. IPPAS B-1204]|nr:MAG: hypothetical protein EDM05_34380 [Leptolyngbya sp. IPPAS B-1204]
MSNNAKPVKKHVAGALGSALESVGKDFTSGEDGMVAKGAAAGGMAALTGTAATLGSQAVITGIATGSVTAIGSGIIVSLAVVGAGAGIGVAFAAGAGVYKYWEANRKGKK